MQQSLKRGTFVEEIQRLQQELQQPGLTASQHKKLAAKLANRIEKHNRNIDDVNRSYDFYARILQHVRNGDPYETLTSNQQYSLTRIVNPFNPINRHFGIKYQPSDLEPEYVINLLRKKINTSAAVRKYKTRPKV
jgi:hypothetical protein